MINKSNAKYEVIEKPNEIDLKEDKSILIIYIYI